MSNQQTTKTLSGTITPEGEVASVDYKLFTVDCNAGAYQQVGAGECARTNVGFNAQFLGTTFGRQTLMDVKNAAYGTEIVGHGAIVNVFGAGSCPGISMQGTDYAVKGPTDIQANRPDYLCCHSVVIENMAPLGPLTSSKRGTYGIVVATAPQNTIDESGNNWSGLTSYPLDAMLKLTGWTGPHNTATDGTSATATVAATKGIYIGGGSGPIMDYTARSKFFDGVYVQDYVNSAFKATSPHPTSNGIAFHTQLNGPAYNVNEGYGSNVTTRYLTGGGTITAPADVTTGNLGVTEYYGYKNSDWRIASSTNAYINATGTNTVDGGYQINTSVAGANKISADFVAGGSWFGGSANNGSLFVDQIPSMVNHLKVVGATSGNHPFISAEGASSNIDFNFYAKGTGAVSYFGYGGGTVLGQFAGVPSATAWPVVTNGVGKAGIKSTAGNFEITPASGTVNIAGTALQINGTQVLGTHKTGWAAPTGTASRATFDPSTVSATQVAQTLKALIDDLTAHGLISA